MFGSRRNNGDKKPEKLKPGALKKSLQLFKYVAPYKGYLILGLVFLLLSSSATLAFPKLLGSLYDSEGSKNINQFGLVLLALFALNAVFSFFRIYLFEHVAQKSLANIRQTTYQHIITLPMNFFATRRVGELVSRISADVALLQSTFTTTIAEFLRQILTILGGIVLLLTISPKLTLFMLGVVPVIVLIVVVFGKYIKKLSKQTQDAVAESNTVVEETLHGVYNVKSYSNERFEISRYTQVTNDIINIAIKAAAYRGAFVSFIIFGLFGAIIGVIWYGLILRESGAISGGELFSFILYTTFIGASIGGIADLYSQLVKAVGATENLFEILEESTEPILETKGKDVTLNGKVEFKNISFHYPNRKDIGVLNNVSFDAESGQEIAIVGPSGAGKSTIVSLLLQFYKPVSGSLLFNGIEASEINLNRFREQFAIVPQEVLLFGGSIKENILYGKPNASDSELIEAAKQANAFEFIEKLPEGFDTIVGDRGIQLSGGQRQRVAIARAVLRDPKILILDEATSSLDSESERLVQDALNKLMKGRTSFVVAHRLSTIKQANKIVVLKEGNVAEIGTHHQLLDQKGEYYKLFSIQNEVVSEVG